MSRAATKERPVSKPLWWLSDRPGHGGLGFDSAGFGWGTPRLHSWIF